MEPYHDVLKKILLEGDVVFEPRTQTSTLGIASATMSYDVRKGYPLLTTKNVPARLPLEELFWKLRGERNVQGLFERNIHIWDGNAYDMHLRRHGLEKTIPKHTAAWNTGFAEYTEKLKNVPDFAQGEGDLGPVYGFQWRHWQYGSDLAEVVEKVKARVGIDIFERIPELESLKHLVVKEEVDQLERLLSGMKKNPGSRYHVLSAWNPADLPQMAIGPCPYWHQFTLANEFVDLTMVQRSNDIFLGNPFNDAQDAGLLVLVAKELGRTPRFFHHQTINTHIYLGVSPRTNFWHDSSQVEELRRKIRGITDRKEFMDIREWYLAHAPTESPGNERKDHVPFVLEQLSKEPRPLPGITVKNNTPPLLEAIQMPALEVFEITDYNPHKWDAKAVMAA